MSSLFGMPQGDPNDPMGVVEEIRRKKMADPYAPGPIAPPAQAQPESSNPAPMGPVRQQPQQPQQRDPFQPTMGDWGAASRPQERTQRVSDQTWSQDKPPSNASAQDPNNDTYTPSVKPPSFVKVPALNAGSKLRHAGHGLISYIGAATSNEGEVQAAMEQNRQELERYNADLNLEKIKAQAHSDRYLHGNHVEEAVRLRNEGNLATQGLRNQGFVDRENAKGDNKALNAEQWMVSQLRDENLPDEVRGPLKAQYDELLKRKSSFAPQRQFAPQIVNQGEGAAVFNPNRPDQPLQPISGGPVQKPGGGGTGSVSSQDAKEVAKAIMDGRQPPVTTGLYRNGAAVRAELARHPEFNLAQAESDWKGTQKHIATLNGQQQERLRQAIQFTSDSTGQIENLYDEWQKLGAASGFRSFNRAELATAKQMPGRMGAVAQGLESQIADLTSELGTVYKGGNSSTDESLKLAAQNLAADWNPTTFKRALGLIRNNLKIRQNSINTSQAAGVSPGSPYTPKGQAQPQGQPQAQPSGAEPTATNPKTGEKVVFRNGQWQKQ